MTKLTAEQAQLILKHWTDTGAVYKDNGVFVATPAEFWEFIDAILTDAHAPPTRDQLTELLQASVAAFKAMSPADQEAMLQKQRESWVRGQVGMGNDAQEAADRNRQEPIITAQERRDRLTEALDVPLPPDPRPANCRFRRQDEGRDGPPLAFGTTVHCVECDRNYTIGVAKGCAR